MLPIGKPETNREVVQRLTWHDWRPTLAAAALAAVAVVAILLGFGSVSSFERPEVVASMIDGIHWLAAAALGACSTIAALTLTTLGLLDRLETRGVSPRFLIHLRLVVAGAFFTIAASVPALIITLFPTATGGEVNSETWWVDAIYFALLALIALIVAGLAIVLTSLYSTIAEVFRNLPASWVDDILADEEVEEARRRGVEEDPGERRPVALGDRRRRQRRIEPR